MNAIFKGLLHLVVQGSGLDFLKKYRAKSKVPDHQD